MGSYNGGRLLEWGVAMWVGVALPQMALHFGYHLATFSPWSDNYQSPSGSANSTGQVAADKGSPPTQNPEKELSLVVLFIISTFLVIFIPIYLYPLWAHITYTAILGFVGAYLRFVLSKLNPKYPTFPLGTFIANISGTWLLAAFTALSKFSVDYYDTSMQAVLYSFSVGFCGCLTTVSTFVVEIDTLPLWASYRYGIISSLVAQAGIILIFNVFAYQSVPRNMVVVRHNHVDICQASSTLCTELLLKIGCPSQHWSNVGCSDKHDYHTFKGTCACGNFSAGLAINRMLMNAQAKGLVKDSLIAAWPRVAEDFVDALQTIDYCTTYEVCCPS
jgi:fluoride ion exporter CrcB/FEX